MSHVDNTTGGMTIEGSLDVTAGTPAIPARVRTVTYFILLGVSALVLLATGLAPIWFEDPQAQQVAATAGVISGVAGLIAGGLGVTYRPTR
ncbi:hypothetical protein MHY85_05060 [Cellulomonas sp. ACRRI]|uniref:hypothetical protein n=1 Tax=Cellulomonas sp. ACRRI TaxID=2918188 RepID=UPI001EF1F864|nr:hypothetical protein [Cellulomonas sp. ACRRI]MCG7285344.1 hypothetical protein [Cellulomonas sp. ACRRI]